MQPLLTLSRLTVRYGAAVAVRGIDVRIREGEIVALLGANGAGKSSTMNAVVGLVPVADGAVHYDGRDITNAAPETLPPQGLTLTPEGRRVFATLSVAENLRMGAYAVSDRDAVQAAQERVFRLFPILRERREQYAGTLVRWRAADAGTWAAP